MSPLPRRFVLRFSDHSELKVLPLLLRHSLGEILPDRTYVLGEPAVQALRKAGIRFTEITEHKREKS